MTNSQPAESLRRTAPDDLEHTVRLIFELANRGQYAQALAYYHPDSRLELAGGHSLDGRYNEKSKLDDLMEVVIKEYGQPRVHVEELTVVGPKVFVETRARLENGPGPSGETREIHVLEFSGGKVRRHRAFTNGVATPRLRAAGDRQ